MNTRSHKGFMTKLASLVGAMSVSALIGFPAVADMHSNKTTAQTAQSPSGSVTDTEKPATKKPASDVNNTPATTDKPTGNVNGSSSTTNTPRTTNPKTILSLAASNNSFETLTAAVKAAGLTDTLNSKGPFTIFAPTDEAFAAIPKAQLDALLKPENKAQLVKLLTYHVVPGNVTSAQLRSGEVKTVEGSPVQVKVNSGAVTVNNAQVLQADVQASNGVIHVIDKVIVPPAASEAQK